MSQTKAQLLDSAYESGAVLTGSTNNTITTVTGANAIQGESTLTYDAGALAITGNSAGDGLSITNDGDHYTELSMDADRGSAANALGIIQGKWNNNSVCSIYLQAGADTSNKDDGQIAFNTSAASSSQATRMVVKNNGDVEINDGNLVIGTSGHGIDFSATANSTGSVDNELLDDYEEGTWTPTIFSTAQGNFTHNNQHGVYTKIGRQVHVSGLVGATVGGTETGQARMSGLPFTALNTSANYGQLVTTDYGNFDSYTGHVGGYMNKGDTVVMLLHTYEGNSTSIATSDWGNSTYIYFNMSYMADY